MEEAQVVQINDSFKNTLLKQSVELMNSISIGKQLEVEKLALDKLLV